MGGARPLGCMISAGFPGSLPRAWCEVFLQGVAEASSRLGVPVVGGNLARSERVFLSLSIFGSIEPGAAADWAVRERTPYALLASDVVEALPRAFRRIMG